MSIRDEHGRAMLIVDNGGGLRMRSGDGERDYMIPVEHFNQLIRLSPDTIQAAAESGEAVDYPEDTIIGFWDAKSESWAMTEAHEGSATGREFVRWAQNASYGDPVKYEIQNGGFAMEQENGISNDDLLRVLLMHEKGEFQEATENTPRHGLMKRCYNALLRRRQAMNHERKCLKKTIKKLEKAMKKEGVRTGFNN